MTTMQTRTLTTTINAPYTQVITDLSDPNTHPEWATEFFEGKTRAGEGDEVIVFSPVMGSDVRFRVEVNEEYGHVDLFLAPEGRAYGAPLPVRLLRNGDGVDVLWTLTRFPGMPDKQWEAGCLSMEQELRNLKARFEQN